MKTIIVMIITRTRTKEIITNQDIEKKQKIIIGNYHKQNHAIMIIK